MKALVSIFSLLLVLMISGMSIFANAQALGPFQAKAPEAVFNGQTFKGFIQIAPGRSLYVNYVAPKPNMPTLIILNGLTYSTLQWDLFVAPLEARGVGLLRYDMYGMGQTLLNDGPTSRIIPYQDQTADLKLLLNAMRLRPPYNIAGLSYGGGIAIDYAMNYPKDIGNVILMAPFTQALEAQDHVIRFMITWTRTWGNVFPYNTWTDEQLYDYCLRIFVYSTFGKEEPIVLKHPYTLESVLRMTQGIRNFKPIESVARLPKNTHLMIAGGDRYIERKVLDGFWDAMPDSAKASRIYVVGSGHKIPEDSPNFAAAWVYEIIAKRNPLLFQRRDFEGNTYTGEVRYKGGSFRISHGRK